MKAVNRVSAIKAAIVFVAGVGTAVVLFVVGYLAFEFDFVSRGRSLDFAVSWFDVAWMVLPNLLIAVFVGRWWRKQDQLLASEGGHPKGLPWLLGYLVVTSATFAYYTKTFTWW